MTTESQISDREREILELVASGATNQQIAHQLNISVNTVKVHLRNIFAKIGVVSRTEATMYAIRKGLIQVDIPADVAADVAVAPEPEPVKPVLAAEAPPAVADQYAPTDPDMFTASPVVPVRVDVVAAPLEAIIIDERGGANVVFPEPRRRYRRLLLGVGVGMLLLLVVALVLVPRFWVEQPAVSRNLEDVVNLPEVDERWRELAAMPAARSAFALAGYAFDGRSYLYVIGGITVDAPVSDQVLRYDLEANTWVAFSQKPTAVSEVQGVVVGNRIYVPGGKLASGAVTDLFEAYDPQRDRWMTLHTLPEPRSGYALATVEGKIYLIGGWDGQTYRNEVWQYNPDRDEWSSLTPMPTARAFAGATVLRGAIHIIGGENETGQLSVHESYTPASDSGEANPWALKAPLPAPNSQLAVATAGNLIFVICGASSSGASLLYNSNLDAWEPLPIPIDPTLQAARVQAVDEKLYILGGQEDDALRASTYEYQAIYSIVLPLNMLP